MINTKHEAHTRKPTSVMNESKLNFRVNEDAAGEEIIKVHRLNVGSRSMYFISESECNL